MTLIFKQRFILGLIAMAMAQVMMLGPVLAQEDPTVASPDQDTGEGADPAPPQGGEGAEFADPGAGFDAQSPNNRIQDLNFEADVSGRGMEITSDAYAIFPDAVKDDIQSLMARLFAALDQEDPKAIDTFFQAEGDRIATVFDQLGLEPTADDLLAMPASTTITFPNEFDNYAAYLDSLELAPFERDYMLQSHEIAKDYESQMAIALGDRERVEQTLEGYRARLEALNERYAEQFREQFLEGIDRADIDGRRPDIDR